jgi:hypothetical protein
MTEWTNSDRAKSARRACETFARIVGQDMDDEERMVVQDLVTNLMHLCHANGGDAYEMVATAGRRFQEEYELEEFGEDE